MYTQPKLYEKITKHPDTLSVYGKQLLDEGTCSAQALEEIKTMVNATLEADFQAAKTWEVGTPPCPALSCPSSLVSRMTPECLLYIDDQVRLALIEGQGRPRQPASIASHRIACLVHNMNCLSVCLSVCLWCVCQWSGFLSPRQRSRIRETGVDEARLKEIGTKICAFPPSLQVHKQLQKIIQARRDTIVRGEGIDWGTAEALAFGTLLLEGNHVRLRCEDERRGERVTVWWLMCVCMYVWQWPRCGARHLLAPPRGRGGPADGRQVRGPEPPGQARLSVAAAVQDAPARAVVAVRGFLSGHAGGVHRAEQHPVGVRGARLRDGILGKENEKEKGESVACHLLTSHNLT